VAVRFPAPVQLGPGAHPASYTMGSKYFLEVNLPEHDLNHPPHLALRLKKK